MSGQVSNNAPRVEATTLPAGPESRRSVRDDLLSAWNRIMAPVSAAPMPPAQIDMSTPAGGRMWNTMLTNGARESLGLPSSTPYIESADPLGKDLSSAEAFKIGIGAPMGQTLDVARQARLNARYLAAALRGSPDAAQLGSEVEQLKQQRAENDLLMRRLGMSQPAASIGNLVGDIFTPSPILESWLPKFR